MIRLYSYFRSSAAYRVRIALGLKQLGFSYETVHLLNQGGEQLLPPYQQKNPQGLVPFMEIDADQGKWGVGQSLAILEYLEETYPNPPLLPKTPKEKAFVRSLTLLIACEIHPINNLRVIKKLVKDFGMTEEQKTQWMNGWMLDGLLRFQEQRRLQWQQCFGSLALPLFCWGDSPSMADCALIPQLYNARRFGCDLSGLSDLISIESHCLKLSAFVSASPEKQPDAS
jgi:maleylpyruvate isomerase